MNEIMRNLNYCFSHIHTLTFIAGVYGMNFQHMPELEYKNGYYTIGVMVVIGIIMVFYFRKKVVLS
jgi:magnesium transporter